jgi:signal transduction histidine kinase
MAYVDGRALRAGPAGLLAATTVLACVAVPLLWGQELVTGALIYPATAVVLALTGALIASRHPESRLGWLLCATGLVNGIGEVVLGYGDHAQWPAAVQAQWINAWIQMIEIGAYGVLLAVFCQERSTTPRWRAWVWIATTATGLMVVGAAFSPALDDTFSGGRNPYTIDARVFEVAYVAGQLLLVASLIASTAALIVGFRRATGVERQQLKWVVCAVLLLVIIGPIALFFYFDSVVVQVAVAIPVAAVPVSMCVATLKYRLYDIDLIINRTIVYGVLSLALAACYVALIVTLGALVGTTHSSWVVAAATLAAAVAFRPLRARIQDAVDRRFRRARWDARGQVDAFLEDLRSGRVAPQRVETVLRDALSRPDLRVAYILDAASQPVDAHGDAVSVDPSRLQFRVERGGALLAVVYAAGVEPNTDPTLLPDIVNRAGLAIEIARLQAQVQHQLGEVTASRARIIAAGYAERRRLERDLHDGAQQRLVSIGLTLRHAQHQLGPSPVIQTIEEAVGQISDAINDLRALANGVRPALLDNGLGVALRELAGRSPLPVYVQVDVDRLAADVETTAYFVACEAMANAVKHSRATEIELSAHHQHDRLFVSVSDNGIGGAPTTSGSGLRGLKDRVAAHGGRLTLQSPPGRGTTVTAELPCGS